MYCDNFKFEGKNFLVSNSRTYQKLLHSCAAKSCVSDECFLGEYVNDLGTYKNP
jgi:hypothetical protein